MPKHRLRFKTLVGSMLLGSAILMAGSGPGNAQINLPTLGDSLSGTVSSQQEFEMGREFLRTVRRQTPQLNDPLIEEYVANLTYKLAAHSELTDHRLEFIVIDSNALNAFAAPGGIIGVNGGLFLYAQNEGQFASVMAHELAHISQRHYARSVQEARNNALPNLAATLAGLVIAATAGGQAGTAALMTGQAVSMENRLRFSRSNEQEADRVGIRTLVNAGFDPNDMAGMFEQMMRNRNFSQRPPEFLSTHPLDENRIADSKNRAATYGPVQHVPNIEYLLMKRRVESHYDSNPEGTITNLSNELPRLTGQQADAARYALALAQLKTGQVINATETMEELLRKEPYRITYVLLRTDIMRAAKQQAQALEVLEDQLRLHPNNHPLTMAYARTLIEDGQFPRAAQVLERHSVNRPNDMHLWYELAEVQGRANNISKVHQARGEYFFTVGELGRARMHFNQALEQERDRLTVARIRQRLDDIRTVENRFYSNRR